MACSKVKEERRSSDHLVVVAIDFGTTYTGFAYSFKSDPSKILASKWSGETLLSATEKAPTCVLLSPDKELIAFGYEAQDKYKELMEEDTEGGEAKDY